jgi:hypothetical protein
MGYRPPLRGRIRYALGGRVAGHEEWVRHDLTDAGWRWRGVARVLVQLLPVMALTFAVPGPLYLHVLMPLFLLLCGVFVAAAYGDELRDRRLRQHRLPVAGRDGAATPPGPSAGGPPR